MLHLTAVCCSLLQSAFCSDVCESVRVLDMKDVWWLYRFMCVVVCCILLHCVAVCCSLLQSVAVNITVCCSELLQSAAVCRSE